ncbi:MAG: hypothetical protein QF741_02265 [Candidatus Peribacteraceae bacterium]|nr:hypothetical protein [Candidatus Peribacteraceae bacterium]MDP7646160.1 hypothetical protein [Candidatus Peribacteraceae bacterium]
MAPLSAKAQSLIPASGQVGSCNFITGGIHAWCIPDYIAYLLGVIFMFIGAIFFLMIVVSGYQIALGSVTGDKEAGRKKLMTSILGFIISAFSFFIIDWVVCTIAGSC